MNKDNLLNSSNTYICENDIYGMLLKTGQYFHVKDIIYLNIKLVFLINII